MARMKPVRLQRLRSLCLISGAALVLVAGASCGGKKPAPEKSGPQQELEVLFRRMQAAWNHIFTSEGVGEYRMARLEVFSGEKETPCGKISAGIHYCAANRTVSVGRGWLEGSNRPEPAVRDYLLARTLARHVQHELTIDERVEKAIAARPAEKDSLLRKRELQTECFAGLWRHYHEGAEPAAEALRQGLRAAAAQGGEEPGLPPVEERLRWFERGLASDEIAACNIFAEPQAGSGR